MMVNMMICDSETLEITYCNKKCLETSGQLSHVLPATGPALLGKSLDLIFGDVGAPRDMLADPASMPYRETVQHGSEFIDVLITAVEDNGTFQNQYLVTWHVVTKQKNTDSRASNLMAVVEHMNANVILCDPGTTTVNYINNSCRENLNSLSSDLPFEVSAIIGQDFSTIDDQADEFRHYMTNPANLPDIRLIKKAGKTLKLYLSAISDDQGRYVSNMIIWQDISEQLGMAERVKQMAEMVSGATSNMQNTAADMSSTADNANMQSTSAARSIDNASQNVQTVAAAAEELSGSISEISRQVQESSNMSENAVKEAERTNDTVKTLSEASSRIGDVVNLINDIAGQTNLLALNATIEAARAGEAGKGFAVVASEVKNLANQTASATEEITNQISEMQNSTSDAVKAIGGIRETIDGMHEIASSISASVTQQGAATQEIAQNITRAAQDTQEVSSNISSVTETAQAVEKGASTVLQSAQSLVNESQSMSGEIEGFIETVIRK